MPAKHEWTVLLGCLLMGLISCGDGGPPDLPSTVLPQATNLHSSNDFAFTLSPDNGWLLFFERRADYGPATELRLLDVHAERLHRASLPEENIPPVLAFITNGWSADSGVFRTPCGSFGIVFAKDGLES